MPDFTTTVGKPYNISKLTLKHIDELKMNFIFSTGRSASSLLRTMLMMHEQVIAISEETFPIALKSKYFGIKQWTKKIIENYCDDFVIMSEGKLYPLFCGKDVLYELLTNFTEHLNYERVVKLSYLAFGVNKDLSKITTIVDKQLAYPLLNFYLNLFADFNAIILVRDPRDNVYSKYKRYSKKNVYINPCYHAFIWNETYRTYLKRLADKNFMLVKYEDLIINKEKCLINIASFLSIPYSDEFFKYPEVVNHFISSIQQTQLKNYFFTSHQSMTQPIMPQKINEWQNEMNQKNIQELINLTWKITHHIAEKFNYQQHTEYQNSAKKPCFIQYMKVKTTHLKTLVYFTLLPFFIRRIIKLIKHPYRRNAATTFDGYFLKNTM